MTALELQRIANRLGNQSHCRHWLNFFDRKTDVMMAIQCVQAISSSIFAPTRVECLEKLGFELYADWEPTKWIYMIRRTNDDGTPFESKLF